MKRTHLFAAFCFLLIAGVAATGAALFYFSYGYGIRAWLGFPGHLDPQSLHPYQRLDPDHPNNILLKPGYRVTLQQLLNEKQKQGQSLGVQHLQDYAAKKGLPPDTFCFQVNASGYKGPEIDAAHTHFRILTIGDSCTFGSPFDSTCYPRALERALKKMGRNVEVINAGVEGYGCMNALWRAKEFQALHPQLTIIFLGWNNLYETGEYKRAMKPYFFRPTNLPRFLPRLLRQMALEHSSNKSAWERPKNPDENAEDVIFLRTYTPTFAPIYKNLIREMKASGSPVVVMTLPGLYRTDQAPSKKALTIGHLPLVTDNPYVLAQMASGTNRFIRSIALEDQLPMVDLAEWLDKSYPVREDVFSDAVHLREDYQTAEGEFIAGAILSLIPKS